MDVINEILKWTLAVLLVWQAYILLFNRGVPNIKTAPAARKRIIAYLKQEIEEKGLKNPVIVDLGSGNGKFSREIAKNIKNSQIIGYEIADLSIKKANYWKNILKIENIQYKKADFFETDLSHADMIVFFLSAYEMGRMGKKLHEGTPSGPKSGALIISNRFPLHNWEVAEELHVKTWLPKQGKINVYRKV